MKKIWRILLLAILVLSILGCQTNYQKNLLPAVHTEDDFLLHVQTDQELYYEDEEINLWATLQYHGEANEVTIGHASEYIRIEITQLDGNLEFIAGKSLLYNYTYLEKDQEYITTYTKNGGYNFDDPDAEFYEKFYESPEMILPPGHYKVRVISEFEWLEKDEQPIEKQEYNMTVELLLKVVAREPLS